MAAESKNPGGRDGNHFRVQRLDMVRNQIEARGVTDSHVLETMRTVERHRFVPTAQRSRAYCDAPLPIGAGQTISQPYIVAAMTEALRLAGDERVLEVGAGSGYQSAVLAHLCAAVNAVERLEELAERARFALAETGCHNVHVRTGDGFRGWPEEAPFHAILVACATSRIPGDLADQLADGGRMVLPLGTHGSQDLVVATKEKGEWHQHSLMPVRFVPMVDDNGSRY